MKIDYTIVDSRLGKLMVAATEKGSARSVLATTSRLKSELEKEFFAATLKNNDATLKDAVNAILKSLDGQKSDPQPAA